MSLHLTLDTKTRDSFRVQQIVGMFDLPERHPGRVELEVELPPPHEPWIIGAIVGPSGSGKTTIARAAFGSALRRPLRWPKDRAVIDAFHRLPLRQTLALLAAVGFNSPPAWLRPYRVLSAGEQFRADLAWRLGSCCRALRANSSRGVGDGSRLLQRVAPSATVGGDSCPRPHLLSRQTNEHSRSGCPTLAIDEFTSHLDRDTARSCSHALQRYLRRRSSRANQDPNQLGQETGRVCYLKRCRAIGYTNANHCAKPNQKPHQDPNQAPCWPLRLVAVTCHDDILPWLGPDWVLRLPEGKLDRGPFVTPPLPLHFEPTNRRAWDHFRPHHYLSGELARGATCYLARWEDRPAAFCAVLAQIGHAGRKRITRLVTLPQFQGLGIGMRLAQHVCRLQAARGFRVSIATSHPAVIDVCRRSPQWRFLGIKRCGGTPQCIRGRPLAGSTGRIVAAFEFNAECRVAR